MDKQLELTIEHYRLYVMNNLPHSWKRVGLLHNVLEQIISAITDYCYEYKLFDRELHAHLYENELICAAKWADEPQGIDWWMDLSSEATMLEQSGCIETFDEDGED